MVCMGLSLDSLQAFYEVNGVMHSESCPPDIQIYLVIRNMFILLRGGDLYNFGDIKPFLQ